MAGIPGPGDPTDVQDLDVLIRRVMEARKVAGQYAMWLAGLSDGRLENAAAQTLVRDCRMDPAAAKATARSGLSKPLAVGSAGFLDAVKAMTTLSDNLRLFEEQVRELRTANKNRSITDGLKVNT